VKYPQKLIQVNCLKLWGRPIRPNILEHIHWHMEQYIRAGCPEMEKVSKISQKEDNLTKYSQIFETFLPDHSSLHPKFPKFCFLRFNSFGFSARTLFPRQFPTHSVHSIPVQCENDLLPGTRFAFQRASTDEKFSCRPLFVIEN